jgi:hypothetical protein
MKEGTQQQETTTRPYYRYICSNSSVGFLNLLNENQQEGYMIDRETLLQSKGVDSETGEVFMKREAYLFDSDANHINDEETSKRTQISDDILEAEFYAAKAQGDLRNLEDDLTLRTDWDLAGAEVGNKISNQSQRDAYIRTQTKQDREWYESCKQWLSHVKRLAALHERATGNPPWIVEADKADEEASKVEVVKVGAEEIGEIREDDIISPDMGRS